jgi:hypothetical protein
MTAKKTATAQWQLAGRLLKELIAGMGFTCLQDDLFAVAGSHRLKETSNIPVEPLTDHQKADG